MSFLESFQIGIFFSIWLILVPLFSGVLLISIVEKKHKRPSSIYLAGWLLMISVFQLVGTFCVLTGKTLTDIVDYFSVLMFACSVVGFLLVVFGMVNRSFYENYSFHNIKNISIANRLTWAFFVVLLGFQVFMAYYFNTPNGDDAYYLSVANMADKLDELYIRSPYIGYLEGLHLRHALSQFPIFYAFLARGSHLHVAIIAHSIMPPVLIIITYLIYYKVASALFDDDENKVPVFMVLISGVQLFGASSEYASEVFFLTRTWQGKSMIANIAIPASILMMLKISKCTEKYRYKNKEKNAISYDNKWMGYCLMLAMCNLIGCFASCLGLLLLAMYEAIVIVIIAIRNRQLRVLVGGILANIPSAIYILIYLFGGTR